MLPYWRPKTVIVAPLATTCVVTPPNAATMLVPLRDTMTIGRAIDNDIAIPDDGALSRRHARLRRIAQGLIVEDLDSDNGTWVGKRVGKRPHLLHVGDTVLAGATRISFVHEVASGPPPAPEVARLLTAICETPEDDEPRTVLADLLTAHADPRGEFIAFQIAAEQGVNLEAHDLAERLLDAHEFAWLAPLVVPCASWTFRRGFLDCVWVLPGQDVAPLRAHHPLRAAVTIGT